jgi:ABC-2 type transport system ATP-binding protein
MAVAAPMLILLVAVGFAAFCLYDLGRSTEARYLPKWAWALIICISVPLGGIVYLAIGRGPAERPEAPAARADWPPPGGGRVGSSPRAVRAAPPRGPDGAGSIEVEHLTKRFGPVTAVDDLAFMVRPGHVTGFLGPNGAGKTTTMRVILGLEHPSAGSATVGGRHYRDIVRPLHEVGTLLDANAAYPGRSARLHVLSVAQSNGIGRRRVEEVFELTGLGFVAHRRVQEFSLGMKQRLGIATALLGDPPILLFDEPVTGLDPEGIHWIRQLFKSLAAEGRTVFVSSHLMSEMALTADHLVIIGRGRLLADTTTEAFVEANARRDVFVRSPRAGELAQRLLSAGVGVIADGDDTLSVTGMEAPAIAELAAADRIPVYELTPRHASLEEAYLDLTRGSVEYRAGSAGDGVGAGR